MPDGVTMKLFRIKSKGALDWTFVLAVDDVDAQIRYCEDCGLGFEDIRYVVEYSLDEPRILPAGWQSESKEML